MKSTLVFGLILLLTTGCNKTNKENKIPVDNNIIGKWAYTENFYGTGLPGSWHPVVPAGQTIEFKPDGTFIASQSFLNGADHFEMVDSVTIKFLPVATATGYQLMTYQVKTADRELYLAPMPLCIEGCNNKFIR